MINKIHRFIEQNRMIEAGDSIVVGVSGGADSTCLLLVLAELKKHMKFSIKAVHVNHGIRGEEALRDQMFTQNLCKHLGIELVISHIDVVNLAQQEKLSVEEAGRKARYELFNEVADERPNSKIAVAHHMDDQSETVLMNMLRGSAIKGICGMQPVRDNIIRPLLCVRRCEIEEFLKASNQEFVTDSTNLDNEYMRNKIRNVVIPYIEENINRSAVPNVAGMAEMVSEAQDYITRQAAQAFAKCVNNHNNESGINNCDIDTHEMNIDVDCFSEYDIIVKKYIIRMIFFEMAGRLKDIYKVHIESILLLENSQVGSHVDLPYGIKAEREYDSIRLYKVDRECNTNKEDIFTAIELRLDELPEQTDKTFVIDGDYCTGTMLKRFKTIKMHLLSAEETIDVKNQQKIIANDYTKLFDYDRIKSIPCLRTRREGDILTINNKGGTKKLKDFFIDQKVPCKLRDRVLVVADGSDIIWIVGMRMSELYKIDDNTKNILRIEML